MVRITSAVSLALFSCLTLFGAACTPSSMSDGSGGSSNGSGGSNNSGSGGQASGSGGSNSGSGGNAASSGGSTGSGGSSTGSGGASNPGSGGQTSGTGGHASGGSTGSGGATTGTGGHASGGTTGTGSGGTTTTGSGGTGTTGTGGSGQMANCTFTQTSTVSTKIPTVGILTWSTTMTNPTSAKVDFGLTTDYGMTAPVDLKADMYRTLLLGMKAAKMYHYRITASGSGGDCVSPDYTIMTGALTNGLPTIKLSPATASATGLFGGFLITGQYVQGAGASGSPAYILDADGDYVWWYNIGSDVTGARMSYDGTHMWINGANVPSGTVHVHRVSMDGMTDEDLSSKFGGQNHQLTVLPDETVAFYGYGSNGCDDIKEYSPATGMTKTIVNAKTAHGGTGACHLNNIQYWKADDSYVFSDLDNVCLTKIDRTGKTIWIANGINGVTSTFTGDTWAGGEHGIHLLAADDFLIFNNNSRGGGVGASGGTGDGSIALEMKLDITGKTMMKKWSYKASPGVQNDVMGDVQRMSNGNTIVGFSTKGVLHEVDSTGKLLQTLTWPLSASFGYIEKRPTLYGPPPK
jgi:hypothetical protein